MSRTRGGVALAAVLDIAVVLLFAGIGRASHHEANPVLDSLVTAWPFLVGAAVGWLIARLAWQVAPLTVRRGWPVWISAVAVGMILRVLVGRGTEPSFIVVATIFLGLFLLGWRLIAELVGRRTRKDRA